MDSLPEPPAIGEEVEIHGATVLAARCTCCAKVDKKTKDVIEHPPVRYLVYRDGKISAMGTDWARMFHAQGWYPLPGLALGDPVPRLVTEADPPKPKPKPKPKVKKVGAEQPPLIPWEAMGVR